MAVAIEAGDIQLIGGNPIAPFRAGIRLDAYQLEPLRKALMLPRVNLFIADDVGLGKTIEAGLIARELLLRRKVRYIVVACPICRSCAAHATDFADSRTRASVGSSSPIRKSARQVGSSDTPYGGSVTMMNGTAPSSRRFTSS